MDELAAEREDLAYLLTKQLDRLEHQSGLHFESFICSTLSAFAHASLPDPFWFFVQL